MVSFEEARFYLTQRAPHEVTEEVFAEALRREDVLQILLVIWY